MIKLLPEEHRMWSQLVHSLTGIVIEDTQGYLIESRLNALAAQNGSTNFTQFFFKVQSDKTKTLERKVIDMMTTRETFFFRDTSPFELIKHKLIPDIIDSKRKIMGPNAKIPIRIWSAACASGQEVYSIAMILRELIPNPKQFDLFVLGTDLSDEAISKASKGAYTKLEVKRGITPERLAKHFTQTGDTWDVKPEIRAMASFQRLNLHTNFSHLGSFDIIFCRNVAIYFSDTDKKTLFSKLGKQLVANGSLIIGSTESITMLCPEFEPKNHMKAVHYQLK